MTSPSHTPLRSSARLLFYTAIVVLSCVASAGVTVIYNLLPTLFRVFEGSPYVGWTVTVYWLGSAISAALIGRLGDLIGYRRMLFITLVLCVAGAVTSALSTQLPLLVAGCALQATAAAITPLTYGLVREHLPLEEIPFAVGIVGAAGMVAAGVCYVGSGMVIDLGPWQGGFWFKVVLAGVGATAVLLWIPAPASRGARAQTPIRWLRGLLFAPAVAALLYAIQNVRSLGLSDPRVWTTLLGGVLVMTVWVRDQARQAHPLIDVRLLARRQILIANLCMACIALGGMQQGQVLSLFFQQPTWTQAGLGLNATQAGWLMLMGNVVALLAAPASGRLCGHFGARRATLIGLALLAATWGAAALVHNGYPPMVFVILVCSFALAFVQPGIYNLVMEDTPPDRTGEAAGMIYVVFSCFFAVGAQAVFALLDTARVSDPAHGPVSYPADAAYTAAFLYGALASVVGILIGLSLPRRGRAAVVAVPLPPVQPSAPGKLG